MSTVLIACNTIKDELYKAIEETGFNHPMLWIESGLHIKPDSLKTRLQQELDHIDNVERVLLAFGYCGNSVIGLKAQNYELIFPRADDCITLMIGSSEKRNRLAKESPRYFITKGWLEYENNIWSEYKATVERMGREKADMVYEIMLKHYEKLGVIETGAYDLENFIKTSTKVASDLKLEHEIIPGTLRFLKKLLTGPWDNEFITITPNTEVTMSDVYGSMDLKPSKDQ
ncbi:MAG: DUF1638 domain-containing protein [Spirochaetes bacterium]|nr:DUF1638 domain-containing protein [Spirochaetota bacterium]